MESRQQKKKDIERKVGRRKIRIKDREEEMETERQRIKKGKQK